MTEYRYRLSRDLGAGLPGRVLWVMLNPSTATDSVDDPTIRRVKSFTAKAGYRYLEVGNLYAARATKPADLFRLDDPVGRWNDRVLAELAEECDMVVAAWGTTRNKRMKLRVGTVLPLLWARANIWRLGAKLKDGAPRHPLYVPKDTDFELAWRRYG